MNTIVEMIRTLRRAADALELLLPASPRKQARAAGKIARTMRKQVREQEHERRVHWSLRPENAAKAERWRKKMQRAQRRVHRQEG